MTALVTRFVADNLVKVVGIFVGVLAAVVLVFAITHWLGSGDRRAAVQAKASATIAAGREKAASSAAAATADLAERDLARAADEKERRDAILSSENAGADAGAAGDVGLGGLCGSPLYRNDPGCVRLRGKGSAPAPR
ncbi:MAG: hypothetical protein ACK4RV_02180 [Caulobacter sp.]